MFTQNISYKTKQAYVNTDNISITTWKFWEIVQFSYKTDF